MDHSPKRRRVNGTDTDNSTSKRFRDVSITVEQQSMINLAARTFQISPEGLLEAINDLKRSSRLLPLDPESATPSNAYAMDNPAKQPQEKFTQEFDSTPLQTQHHISNPVHTMNSQRADPGNNSVFGFNFNHSAPWADCFANMTPFYQQDVTGQHQGMQNLSAKNPMASFQNFGNNTSENFDASDGWCYPLFDCDAFNPEIGFNDFSPDLPAFTPLQTTQPSASGPSMTFTSTHNPVNYLDIQDLSSIRVPGSPSPPASSDNPRVVLEELEDGEAEAALPKTVAKAGKRRRGGFKNSDERDQTAQTRTLTACIRCRMQRIRCIPNPDDPRGVCLTCTKVVKFKATKLPCLRYKITDVRLFVTSFAPGRIWSTRWQDMELREISNWASTDIRTIHITQDFSSSAVALEVRKFVPLPTDLMNKSWAYGGIKKSVTMPPYALANMKKTLQTYMECINQQGTEHVDNIINRDDHLLRETYSAAIKASNSMMTENEQKLVKMIFRLWVASRMTTKPARLCSDDKLGISPAVFDETHPQPGQVPITPVMGAQIDVILTRKIMVPLRTRILERLSGLVLANKPGRNAIYARKHSMRGRFANMEDVSEIFMGANILLAHFHYACKGYHVFDESCDAKDLKILAELNEEQVLFIQKTKAYVKAKQQYFANVLEEKLIESEHYFIAQLYELDWRPRSPGF